jgi:MFS family permease
MKKSNKFLALFALGMVYGTMYNLPYIKYIFYDAMIEAMGITNAQTGSLLAYYALACIITYIPGGWIADKFAPKKILVISGVANGLLCIFFAMTMQNFAMARLVWILCALTGSAQFWAAIIKAVRLTGGTTSRAPPSASSRLLRPGFDPVELWGASMFSPASTTAWRAFSGPSSRWAS